MKDFWQITLKKKKELTGECSYISILFSYLENIKTLLGKTIHNSKSKSKSKSHFPNIFLNQYIQLQTVHSVLIVLNSVRYKFQ